MRTTNSPCNISRQDVYFMFWFSILKKFHFYILIMDEKVLVLCEKWISKFSWNLYVLRPPESEKTVFTKVSVCLSVWEVINTLLRFSILNIKLTTVFCVFCVITAIYEIFFNNNMWNTKKIKNANLFVSIRSTNVVSHSFW